MLEDLQKNSLAFQIEGKLDILIFVKFSQVINNGLSYFEVISDQSA